MESGYVQVENCVFKYSVCEGLKYMYAFCRAPGLDGSDILIACGTGWSLILGGSDILLAWANGWALDLGDCDILFNWVLGLGCSGLLGVWLD